MGAQHLFPVRWNGRGTEAVCRVVVGDGLAFLCLCHRQPIDPIGCLLCGGAVGEGLDERKSACRRGMCRVSSLSSFRWRGRVSQESGYHGDKHTQQTKTRDDSVMLKDICSCN